MAPNSTTTRTDSGPVLLPVFTDDLSRNALGIAVDLAEHRGTELIVIGMESVPKQTSLSHPTPISKSRLRSQIYSRQAREIAPPSLEITNAARVGHGVGHIILREVEDRQVQDLVLEQTVRVSSSCSLSGDPLNSVSESAECNVVLSAGAEYFDGISSILVPVAGGPHSGLAVDIAKALAIENNAWIEVFHVLDPEAAEEERNRSDQYVNAAMARLDDFERADEWVFEASDPAEAIIEQAQYYDLAILGAPQKGRLRRFVFGSTTEIVSGQAECSLITVRSSERQQSLFKYWLGRGT